MIKLHLHVFILLCDSFEENSATVVIASIGPLNSLTAVNDLVEVPLDFEHPPVFLYDKGSFTFFTLPLFALTKWDKILIIT